jgi:hypothetical protein
VLPQFGNNTRKSRRLQERDGNRSTVDDTIEDVVKNSNSNQTPRRSTRQNTNTAASTAPKPPTTQSQATPTNTVAQVAGKPLRNRKKGLKVSEPSEQVEEKVPKLEDTATTKVQSSIAPASVESPRNEVQEHVKEATPNAPSPLIMAPKVATPQVRGPLKPDSTEPMTLIDPVTGELIMFTQGKEGQYVPIPGEKYRQQPVPSTSTVVSSMSIIPPVNTVTKTHLSNMEEIKMESAHLSQKAPSPIVAPRIEGIKQDHAKIVDQLPKASSPNAESPKIPTNMEITANTNTAIKSDASPIPLIAKSEPSFSSQVIKPVPIVTEQNLQKPVSIVQHTVMPPVPASSPVKVQISQPTIISQAQPQPPVYTTLKSHVLGAPGYQNYNKPTPSTASIIISNAPITSTSSTMAAQPSAMTQATQPHVIREVSKTDVVHPNVIQQRQVSQQLQTVLVPPHSTISQTSVVQNIHQVTSGQHKPPQQMPEHHRQQPQPQQQSQQQQSKPAEYNFNPAHQQHLGPLTIQPTMDSGVVKHLGSPHMQTASPIPSHIPAHTTQGNLPSTYVPTSNSAKAFTGKTAAPPRMAAKKIAYQQQLEQLQQQQQQLIIQQAQQQQHLIQQAQQQHQIQQQQQQRQSPSQPTVPIKDQPHVITSSKVPPVGTPYVVMPQTTKIIQSQAMPPHSPVQIIRGLPANLLEQRYPFYGEQKHPSSQHSPTIMNSRSQTPTKVVPPSTIQVTQSQQQQQQQQQQQAGVQVKVVKQPQQPFTEQIAMDGSQPPPPKVYLTDTGKVIQHPSQTADYYMQMMPADVQRRKTPNVPQSPVILTKQSTQPIPMAKPTVGGQIIPPPPQNKTVIGLNHPHQTPQIMQATVASPPLKQQHFPSQPPNITGASSSRVNIPSISPQDQRAQIHGAQIPGYEANLGDGTFSQMGVRPRSGYMTFNPFYRGHQENLGVSNLGSRVPMVDLETQPGKTDRETAVLDDRVAATPPPPLELRRTTVPLSMQSPGDRISDSPQLVSVPNMYVGAAGRIPPPHYYEGTNRVMLAATAEPPPAHRPSVMVLPQNYTAAPSPIPPPTNLSHMFHERDNRGRELDRERERERESENERDRERDRTPVPATGARTLAHSKSLLHLLYRYPVMWQGLLVLKNDQAAVQMHFVHGNRNIANNSLPMNNDCTTPPLRIVQRMRLEQTQIEGVSKKMQIPSEHCILLALPCGRDPFDVISQSTNLTQGFITYLQQKQAAGIINIAQPNSQNPSYVIHIFPACEFANESLAKYAPDLLDHVKDLAHVVIVIATV